MCSSHRGIHSMSVPAVMVTSHLFVRVCVCTSLTRSILMKTLILIPMHIVLLLFLLLLRSLFSALPATQKAMDWLCVWVCVCVLECLCHIQKVHIWISLHKKLDDLPQRDTPQSTIKPYADDTILLQIPLWWAWVCVCVLCWIRCVYLFILRTSQMLFYWKASPFKFSFCKSDSNGVIVCVRGLMRDVCDACCGFSCVANTHTIAPSIFPYSPGNIIKLCAVQQQIHAQPKREMDSLTYYKYQKTIYCHSKYIWLCAAYVRKQHCV